MVKNFATPPRRVEGNAPATFLKDPAADNFPRPVPLAFCHIWPSLVINIIIIPLPALLSSRGYWAVTLNSYGFFSSPVKVLL